MGKIWILVVCLAILTSTFVAAHEAHKANTQEIAMANYTIMQKPEMLLVGIECRTSNASEAGSKDIPAHWERFYSENIMDKIPNKTSDDILALYCDYEGDYTQPYTLIIGCPVKTLDGVPDGMVAKRIPGGMYTAYHAIGKHPESLIETWQEIWQTDLPRSYTGDYEVYGRKFTSGSPQEVEVYIAIEE